MRLSNLILSPIVLLIALLSTAHAQDTTPPTANIATTNEAVISGTASDNVALDRIELAIRNSDIEFWNGTAFGNYTRVPAILQADGTWQYQFSPKLPPDDYVVVSFAFDSAGNVQNPRDVANFSVLPADNSPPTATTTLATSLTVAGNASDNISLDRVELEIRNSSTQFFRRAYHNSVVLPNGEIIVVGGQTYPVPFSDNNSILAAELWNPVNETFRTLASMSTPRNYHSIALLLYDGRVLAGGGGLCGNCTTNHADVEIFTPPYLLDGNGNLKSRPNILSAPGNSFHGEDITVVTDQPIDSIVIVRAAVVTHSVNNDQRRIPLQFVNTSANIHVITIPSDPGIAPPGNYLLFVLDANGTPSVAKNINVQ